MSDLLSLQKDNKKSRIKDFLSKSNKIHIKLRIWPHLLEKSLIIKNFIFIQGLQGYFGKCFIKTFYSHGQILRIDAPSRQFSFFVLALTN